MRFGNGCRVLNSAAVVLLLIFSQVPFTVGEWLAVGEAPIDPGAYDLVIRATYDGIVGSFPLRFTVGNQTSEYNSEGLSVEPVFPWSRVSPIRLKYNISVDGSPDLTMLSNNLTLYYESGGVLLKSDEGALSEENGYWYSDVNVPLKGEYRAEVSVLVESEGGVYGGGFVTVFDSANPSSDLHINYNIDKRVLLPSEEFEVSLVPEFEGRILPGLDIFNAGVYGGIKGLVWNGRDRYEADFTAPAGEGIYVMSIYADGQDYADMTRVYVSDISRAKSARCPLDVEGVGSCSDMKDVRKCVSDYKGSLIQISEIELISCYESAGGEAAVVGSFVCDGAQKGDFTGDGQIDERDLEVLQNIILPLSQSMRQEYVECADYNLDGVVNEADLQCLTNVVAGKWAGDLNGGICMDLVYDTPLKCDLDGDDFITNEDTILMRDILTAADADIEVPGEILDTCDFDQDGRITQEDMRCLDYFKSMELANPSTLLMGGQTIPSKCMAIYTLDNCMGIAGDINGDGKIDEIDEILMMLVYQNQITGYDMSCADVNKDGILTEEDIFCVKSYTAGDLDTYFACIGCDEYTPPEYRSLIEICNDGVDNNCNGLIDRTSLTPSLDECVCGEHTSCMTVWDSDGGQIAGIDDGNILVCRKLSWEDEGSALSVGSGYRWVSPIELLCVDERECESVECKNTMFKCAFDGISWNWYENPGDMVEETDDPLGSPKLCEDGYDNDCRCGDRTCKELESGNMFSSWEFWVGLVVGAALTIFCPPCGTALFYLALAATAATILLDLPPGVEAALSGFSMGVSAGNLVNGFVTTASEQAVKTGVEEVAKAQGAGWFGQMMAAAGESGAQMVQGAKDFFASFKSWSGALDAAGMVARNTLAKMALGYAGSLALQDASLNYAENKAEWITHAQTCP
jgi:hypothetical protein